MQYILIIMLFSGGPATSTATFETKEACEYAAQMVKSSAPPLTGVRTICVAGR